jgi:hypothetical protein
MGTDSGRSAGLAARVAAVLAALALAVGALAWLAGRGGSEGSSGGLRVEEASTSSTAVAGSERVEAADGSWSMEIGPGWRPTDRPGADRAWLVGPTGAPVVDTVTVTATPGRVPLDAAVAAVQQEAAAAGRTAAGGVETETAPDGHRIAVVTVADPPGEGAATRSEVVLHEGPDRLVRVQADVQDDRADEVFLALRPLAASVRFPDR